MDCVNLMRQYSIYDAPLKYHKEKARHSEKGRDSQYTYKQI